MDIINNSTRGGRNLQIDIIKGISIVLVLWGHMIQNLSSGDSYYNDWIFRTIYSFHMPLFALISGYLFYPSQQRRNFLEAVRSRVTGLLVPIMTWTTLDWILRSVLHRKIAVVEWKNIFTGNMLWFLWSIFAADLVLIVAEKLIKTRWGRTIWLATGFLMMYVFPNAELNLFLYPYVVLGFYYKKRTESFLRVKKYGWICILLYITLLPLYKVTSFIYTTGISVWKSDVIVSIHMLIDLYRYIIGLAGSIAVIYMCVLSRKIRTFDRGFSMCGQYTMQIYIMQCFFFKFFGIVWVKIKNEAFNSAALLNTSVRNIMVAIPFCVILLLTLLFISKIFERNSHINKILFGR